MDYHLMEKTIATVMGIPARTVMSWHVSSGADNRGMIINQMEVRIAYSEKLMELLRNDEHKGSFRIADQAVTMQGDFENEHAQFNLVLLQGRETARIFNVLARLMQYHKPKKRRKK